MEYSCNRRFGSLHSQFQEFVQGDISDDISVASLETAYVAIALDSASQPELVSEIREALSIRTESCSSQNCHRVHRAQGRHISAESCAMIHGLHFEAKLRQPVRTVREPPRWFRESLRQAFALALRDRTSHKEAAWELFVLIPLMLLEIKASDVSLSACSDSNVESGVNSLMKSRWLLTEIKGALRSSRMTRKRVECCGQAWPFHLELLTPLACSSPRTGWHLATKRRLLNSLMHNAGAKTSQSLCRGHGLAHALGSGGCGCAPSGRERGANI